MEIITKATEGLFPLTRGIPGGLVLGLQDLGITPAYAGNTHPTTLALLLLRDYPRLRGEYFLWCLMARNIQGLPPLTRGIPARRHGWNVVHGITPAYAGNTDSLCIKHFSGVGLPPLTRGILPPRHPRATCPGITPAYAGNTPVRRYP